VLQQIESHIVTPKVMRSQTLSRPATVIVALITGHAVGGLLGAIAAIPVFAAARVLLLLHVVAPEPRRRQQRPKPSPPVGRPRHEICAAARVTGAAVRRHTVRPSHKTQSSGLSLGGAGHPFNRRSIV
jgi:hypothetical protein